MHDQPNREVHMKARAALPVAAAILLCAPAAALSQEVSYSGSFQYATGEYYFAERTHSAYLLTGLTVEVDRVRVSADVPVIWQSTPWVSYVPGRGLPTGGTQEGETRDGLGQRDRGAGGDGGGRGGGMPAGASAATGGPAPGAGAATVRDGRVVLEDTTTYEDVGVGDPGLRAEVDLLRPGAGPWSVVLGGELKAPLADPDQGFGTGEWDGGISLSVARRISSTFLFGELGYRVLGDMEELELHDPLSYSAGVGRTAGDGKVALLASVSGFSRIVDGTDPPVELGAGLSYRISPRRSVSVNASVGLTESSPDLSLAAGWTIGL